MLDVQVAVIGGGPAGLAAALECHKQGITNIMILERDTHLGGILQQCIHNGFGLHYFGEELSGPEYAQRFINELDGTDITVKLDTMVIGLTADKVITAVNQTDGLLKIRAEAVILAMGCRERTRGALSIPGFRPSGVFTAGLAQRLVNMEGYIPGRKVVILGSGDIGLIMARRMTWEGAEVKAVCELMPWSSGLTRNIVQCLQDNEIPLKLSHTVVKIHGRQRVTGVTIAKVDENLRPIPETFQEIECDTLLLSVGLIPENELTISAGITLDPITGGAVVDQNRQTANAGIFACGNVLHVHDLVDNVSAEAILAGRQAAKYVNGEMTAGLDTTVRAQGEVRYTVPQHISGELTEPIDLYFRVGRTVKNAVVEVLREGKVVASRRSQVMKPGEMETIQIKPDQLRMGTGDITLQVTGGKKN